MVTGAIYKGFTFDGLNSKNYGIYISGQGVFDAPVRDVEMIEIPGRNGSYALDKGRFNNIEVTYPGGTFGNNESEFAQAISDFRNALASRVKYCRLTDDYNPNEYRMAVYKGGLEVSPAQLKAGEFDITFDCKPQRFLTSGETEQTVTSGGTITNPTLFDAKPLLQVRGYGGIDINGEEISISLNPLGYTILKNPTYSALGVWSYNIVLEPEKYTTGDVISIDKWSEALMAFRQSPSYTITNIVKTSQSGIVDDSFVALASGGAYAVMSLEQIDFTVGTALTKTATLGYDITISTGGVATTSPVLQSATVAWDGVDTITFSQSPFIVVGVTVEPQEITKKISTYSNATIGNNVINIDLDIGEAYYIDNGVLVSLNNVATIPAELPTLKPGANTITYDNTFTSFKITPRWWRV